MNKKAQTNFGKNVLTLLLHKGIEMATMEEELNYSIGSLEKNYIYGKRPPSKESLKAISEYLGESPEVLMNDKLWIEYDIENLQKEFIESNFSKQSDFVRCAKKVLKIVPEKTKEEYVDSKINESKVGEVLVKHKKFVGYMYAFMAVVLIINITNPSEIVQLITGMLLLGGSLLLFYTIKNEIWIDKQLRRIVIAELVAFSVFGAYFLAQTY